MSYMEFAHEHEDYLKCLPDEDIQEYKDMDMDMRIRWILNRKRIDWKKFFKNCNSIHTLAKYAAADPSVRPVAYFKPEWVKVHTHEYNDDCPKQDIHFDVRFYEACKNDDLDGMLGFFEVIEMRNG